MGRGPVRVASASPPPPADDGTDRSLAASSKGRNGIWKKLASSRGFLPGQTRKIGRLESLSALAAGLPRHLAHASVPHWLLVPASNPARAAPSGAPARCSKFKHGSEPFDRWRAGERFSWVHFNRELQVWQSI